MNGCMCKRRVFAVLIFIAAGIEEYDFAVCLPTEARST